ncbi:M23 family metallopeptidase [Aureimonas jatrophae]|uniref:Murein DD-endopeptidase MepM and murein hydrolase activator NlpD, contain LysM domain n=1 Tax=Aureimonas jatrophae TaxID=1166073 RepID=A0A1H0ME51_9HYPH|nr:M23 family metallopeptidase [Aureimonas jatrophae]MBB3951100.1 murein DD-endopeptidase MepM/ murein hydrolase activator NlpD [Aureimonas jatrophae]SDO78546.1 Murein DD-endopeptidase MepM and murein hydrolase activator NlpD, contain LysM domain [Aureimonas jatrophae]
MAKVSRQEMFGQRSLPHTIVIARGEKVRHWTVRPWVALSLGTTALATLVGAAGVGSILLMGGPVLEAVQTRDAHTASAYEERIAELRRQLDRLTTRQAVDRTAVAERVDALLKQQAEITARFERLGPLLQQARDAGLVPSAMHRDEAVPQPERSTKLQDLSQPFSLNVSRDDPTAMTHLSDELLPTIRQSVDYFAEQQETQIASLTREADTKADRISDLLGSIGVDAPEPSEASGGPFVGSSVEDTFSQSLEELQQSLDLLDRLRRRTDRLPLADPLPGARMTSGFGSRTDPFLREPAYHTGIDFAAQTGTAIRPTAPGRVVSAGYAGGYGLMVEVDHGDGLSTRYGHMSRIAVAVGDQVTTTSTIGAVGSTGRSTGAHLHYEVRSHEEPVNPDRWIKAGRRLAAL